MTVNFDSESSPEYFDSQGCPLRLCFDKLSFVADGLVVHLDGVPLLKEDGSGAIYFPAKTRFLILDFLKEARERGDGGIDLVPKWLEKRYRYAEAFRFLYSHIDYEYIPGLARASNDGFLTPVFFDKAVLAKYGQYPDYTLDLFSDTYGTVRCMSEAVEGALQVVWSIEFGITRSGRVIMWLGDIDRLPDKEKYYLRSENVPSDHDIHSQFYDAQIDVKWSNPSLKDVAYDARRTLAVAVSETYAFELFSMNTDVLSMLQSTAVPVFWEKRHVAAFFNFVNQLFVEAINVKALRHFLTSRGIPEATTDELKGCKLLEKLAVDVLGMTKKENIVSPFFVLYDVRLLCSHYTGSNEAKLERTVRERLGLRTELPFDFESVFHALMPALRDSCNALTDAIRGQSGESDSTGSA
ncbi:hypothetical protein [Xanthomonas sp. NCPPB 2632]|uniref:hypothetical protein n=1 Tax=Xanthomonas sp. NCPPB 2632 TaxID=3240912 RepID=UPI0035188C3F